ncbi:MAG TPA: BON domain-containing protein, partial [Vicinamibacteria bacterium]|nr:BON domain-containing protein [Vicinamibacteria bacterium]
MKGSGALLGTVVVVALALAPACRNTSEGVKEDSRQNGEKVRQETQEAKGESQDTAHKIGEKAKEVGGKVTEGTKSVGEKVKEGANEVGSEVGAKKQTVDVKAALMLDKSIDASHIEVDTDADTKTVTLKGKVPTAAQKAAAEKVAREKA